MTPPRVTVQHAMRGEPIRLCWPDGAGGQCERILSTADCLGLINSLARAVARELAEDG